MIGHSANRRGSQRVLVAALVLGLLGLRGVDAAAQGCAIEATAHSFSGDCTYRTRTGCNGGVQCGNCCVLSGSAYCGGACTDYRLSCGACGSDTDEVCDGIDNNGDGSVDDDCRDRRANGAGTRRSATPGVPSAPCNSASCMCQNTRGDPVTVGTGSLTLDPIEVVRVRGPWQVPLEFTLHYSTDDDWDNTLDHSTNPFTWEQNGVGRGWSHSFSEAIAVFAGDNSRRDPASITWPSTFCGVGLGTTRVVYRTVGGGSYEFGYGTASGVSTCQDSYPTGYHVVRLASTRGSPYELTASIPTAGAATYAIRDLTTGIKTTFDTHGRMLSRMATTASSQFGWTATYDATGTLTNVTHSSGHQLSFAHGTTNQNETYLTSVSLIAPDATTTLYGTFTRGGTIPGSPAVQFGGTLGTVTLIDNTTRSFEYHLTVGGVNMIDPRRMTRALLGGSEILRLDYPAMPTCDIGTQIRQRARMVMDRTGRWEFRRHGTGVADTQLCTGSTPSDDPTERDNPCAATSGVAVLEVNQRQIGSGGAAQTCTADSGCGSGFLCSDWADTGGQHYCVRYSCQQMNSAGTPSHVYPDQPTQIAEGGCGSCSAQFSWETIGGTDHPLNRIIQRLDASGLRTLFLNDLQGRVQAACEGADASTVRANLTNPAACPATARWTRYYYDDTNYPWAVSRVEFSSVLAPAGSIGSIQQPFQGACVEQAA